MKELKLVLKKKWYDLIDSGEKKEEYRDLTIFWEKRLWEHFVDYPTGPKEFDAVTFYLGYAKDRPSMSFEWKGTEIRTGKEEWGAEPGTEYFVIKLGDRIK